MLLNLESGAYAFTADPDEGTLTIGRENDCNFVVKEEGISRHHCKLWFEDGNWLVEDSESRWGTLVNNKQVQQPTELKHGDVLRLSSSVTFMVTLHRTNDHGAIGKQLAGGARDKLKLLNDNNKASAKASRTLRASGKDSNKRLPKAAPKAEEEELDEVVSDADTATTADTSANEEASSDAGESKAPESETSGEEAPADDKKKGSKLKIPAKGLSGKTSASRTARAGKGAKEAPKKGGGMVKTLIAVVVLAGGGAGAYFATDGFGMNTPAASEKKPGEADAKPDAAKDEAKEAPKDTPAGPVIPPIPPKDKEEAKPEEKAGNTGNSEPASKQ